MYVRAWRLSRNVHIYFFKPGVLNVEICALQFTPTIYFHGVCLEKLCVYCLKYQYIRTSGGRLSQEKYTPCDHMLPVRRRPGETHPFFPSIVFPLSSLSSVTKEKEMKHVAVKWAQI